MEFDILNDLLTQTVDDFFETPGERRIKEPTKMLDSKSRVNLEKKDNDKLSVNSFIHSEKNSRSGSRPGSQGGPASLNLSQHSNYSSGSNIKDNLSTMSDSRNSKGSSINTSS